MIDWLIGMVLEGIAGVLVRAVAAPRPTERPRAIRDAIDEATAEELERLSAWARSRGLAPRGNVFTGSLDGMAVALDPGCDGSSPRGPELVLRIAGLATMPSLVTERDRGSSVLGDLYDDATLHGALRSIAVTPEGVRLRFAPRRSPEILDVALRLLRELDLEIAAPVHAPRTGVYR